jgi:DnaJ-class molecular chaperone
MTNDYCETCNGRGDVPTGTSIYGMDEFVECSACDGRGIRIRRELPPVLVVSEDE